MGKVTDRAGVVVTAALAFGEQAGALTQLAGICALPSARARASHDRARSESEALRGGEVDAALLEVRARHLPAAPSSSVR